MTDAEVLASLGRGPGDELAPFPADDPGATALGAVPPSTVPIVPSPDFGPPAPDATDPLLATLPPVPPTGTPTRDGDKEWPPSVPAGAPGSVPVAPSLRGPPGSAPQGIPGEPAPEGGVAGALDAARAARGESDEARQRVMEGGQEADHAAAEAAAARAKLAADRVAKEQDIQKQYADADKVAAAQVQQTQQALKDFKFRDLWDSKSTVQKIGSALSTALLAIGAGMMKTPKYAIEILDKEMDDDHKRQVDHLNQLKDADVMARTDLNDSRAARTRAMADLSLGDAQKDRVIAAQFEETAARAKDDNSANEARAFAAKLKQEAAEKDVTAQSTLRNFAIQDAAAKAKADEAEALARLHNTQAAAGGYNPNTGKGRHGAGSGSGSGGASSHGETLLTQKIEEFQKANGGAMPSQGQIYSWADSKEINLPHEGKAGHPSVANVLAHAGKLATTAGTGERTGLMGDKTLDKETQDFAHNEGVPKQIATQRKLQEVISKLRSGNGMAAMSAMLELDAAAKGGAATESSLHALQEHMGGNWEALKGALQRRENGAFGDDQMHNMRQAAQAALDDTNESLQGSKKKFFQRFDGGKPGVMQRANGLFGGEGGGGPEKPQGKRVKLKNGTTGTLEADGVTFHPDQ